MRKSDPAFTGKLFEVASKLYESNPSYIVADSMEQILEHYPETIWSVNNIN